MAAWDRTDSGPGGAPGRGSAPGPEFTYAPRAEGRTHGRKPCLEDQWSGLFPNTALRTGKASATKAEGSTNHTAKIWTFIPASRARITMSSVTRESSMFAWNANTTSGRPSVIISALRIGIADLPYLAQSAE